MSAEPPAFPKAIDDDDDDVAWALQTAAVQWERGGYADAVVWLRRAAQAAVESGEFGRAADLERGAREVEGWVERGVVGPEPDDDDGVDSLLAGDAPDIESAMGDHTQSIVDALELEARAEGVIPRVTEDDLSEVDDLGDIQDVEDIEAVEVDDLYEPENDSGMTSPRLPGYDLDESGGMDVDFDAPESKRDGREAHEPETLPPPPGGIFKLPPPPIPPVAPRKRSLPVPQPKPSSSPSAGPEPLTKPRIPKVPRAAPVPAPFVPVPAPFVPVPAPPEPERVEEATAVPAALEPAAAPRSSEPARALDVELVAACRGLEDLPPETQAELAARARVETLAPEQEVSAFGLALVIRGSVAVMPTIAEASCGRAVQGEPVFAQGSLADGVALRAVAEEEGAEVAVWRTEDFQHVLATCPWVAEELHVVADRYQALAGAAMGLLGERLDDSMRALVTDRGEVKLLAPGDVLFEQGKPVAGINIVGAGKLEQVVGDAVQQEFGPGDLPFSFAALSHAAAPGTLRAGPGGALVLYVDRMATHELVVSIPPLLELLATA